MTGYERGVLKMSFIAKPTIEQAEATLEKFFSDLPTLVAGQVPSTALKFLAPAGYQAVVELISDSGRTIRRRDTADEWDPEQDEIRIYFEPVEAGNGIAPRASVITDAPPFSSDPADLEKEVEEICEALGDAERAGRAFIALKWFRDEYLSTRDYAWVPYPERRQAVLAAAIEGNWILTSKIPNPRSPQFPTTTIRLNRSRSHGEVHHRFAPVTLDGDPVTSSLLRDREEN
jgi:hypothetical protein